MLSSSFWEGDPASPLVLLIHQPQKGTWTSGVYRQMYRLWSNTGHLHKLIEETVVQTASFTFLADCGNSTPTALGLGEVHIKHVHTPCLTGLTTSPGKKGSDCCVRIPIEQGSRWGHRGSRSRRGWFWSPWGTWASCKTRHLVHCSLHPETHNVR